MKEKYQPSQEEINKAENMMTPEQKLKSKEREQGESYKRYFDALNDLINAKNESDLVHIFSDEEIFEMGFNHPWSYSERVDWLVERANSELEFISDFFGSDTSNLKKSLSELAKKAKISIAKAHFNDQEQKVSKKGNHWFYRNYHFSNFGVDMNRITKAMEAADYKEKEISEMRKKIPELRQKTALFYAESELEKLKKMIRGRSIPFRIIKPGSEEFFEIYQKYNGPRTSFDNVKELIKIAEEEGVDVEEMKNELKKLEKEQQNQLPKKQ